MKNKLFKFSLAIVVFTTVFTTVPFNWNLKAQEDNENELMTVNNEVTIETEDSEEELFEGMEETEKVLELPNGGYIYGEGTFRVLDPNGNLIASYDVETDPNSITVAEAREEYAINETTSQISPFAAGIPGWWDTLEIDPGGYYRSNEFSGSGWRYGGYRIKPTAGSGQYLLWSTYGDDGRVAIVSPNDYAPGFVFNPNYHSTAIYQGTYTYFGQTSPGPFVGYYSQFYCTYNPAAKSYYLVENR